MTIGPADFDDASLFPLFTDRGMRRFWLRALLAPYVALSWRAYALSLYRSYAGKFPSARVLSKPLHGYLRRGIGPAARLRLLVEHYRLFEALFEPDCLRALCAGEEIEIIRLAGRNGSQFRLCLVNPATVHSQREGECTLCLRREGDPTPLCRLTFSLLTIDGALALAIGGLQGPVRGHKGDVVSATRDLRGLRPKDATLLAVRALADSIGASVHAVRDALHVHRKLSEDPKFTSYDAYWLERGAALDGPFGFRFPPLSSRSKTSSGRDAMKHAIANGILAFACRTRRSSGRFLP